ncbi:hypothetical protein ACGFZL_24235 [Streptomyces sp. NPDC048182]|uniref:hypothetical protein n=1 Tax=Streptomyces sp. NPDC048182 TaxID=3365507 RepID=UPI00371397D7
MHVNGGDGGTDDLSRSAHVRRAARRQGPAHDDWLVVSAWTGGGAGVQLPVLAVGVPLAVGMLMLAGTVARAVVPWCGTTARRLGWAVLVFTLGTIGVALGPAVYSRGVGLGSAEVRIALTGAAYAVAAALFVPSRWVRSAGLGAPALAVA